MPLALTPLEIDRLSPAVRRVLDASAPTPMRLAVARGAAPLPPPDLATALYQIAAPWDDHVDGAADAARRTPSELPDSVAAAALSAPLDGRVLDWLARALHGRAALVQILLANRATADETFAYLAQVAREPELLAIARNEQRLLRHPPIIAALYLNPRTPMSVAARAVELAIRNGVTVDIPGFEEVRASIESEGGAIAASGRDDDAFRIAAEPDPDGAELPPPTPVEAETGEVAETDVERQKQVPISQMSIASKLRLAAVGGAFARAVLVRDANRLVALAAVKAPGLGDNEVVRYAANRSLSEEVIRHLSANRHFTRLYAVKVSLVNNPKCPLQAAMGFLSFLTPRDLKQVSRSKGIPSPLARAAQGLLQKRSDK